jgi:hypothetical protein
MRADDDDVLRSLLGGRPPASDCPEEGLLAAWAEDRLEDERRDRVESHLALCDDCRAVALAQREAAQASPALPAAGRGPAVVWPFRRRRLLRAVVALAAVVVVGVGLAWFRSEPDAAERLSAAAAAGSRANPALLAGFRPLSRAELAAGSASVLRGGIAMLEPAEHLLGPPMRFRWKPVAGATGYRVTLLDGAGMPLWTRETLNPALDWPTEEPLLAPGAKAVLEVTADAVLGQVEGRRAFDVATAAAARSYAEAAGVLAAQDRALADLLRAHLALRRGYLPEAESAAWAQLRRTPEEPLVRATLEGEAP